MYKALQSIPLVENVSIDFINDYIVPRPCTKCTARGPKVSRSNPVRHKLVQIESIYTIPK